MELKNLRMVARHTYKAETDCELLQIRWDTFRDAIIRPAKEEFLRRIKLLKDCKYIKEVDPYGAVILSLLGTITTLGYGEIILKQGTDPTAFYVILQGECKCVYDKILTRSEEVRGSEARAKGFTFGMKDYNSSNAATDHVPRPQDSSSGHKKKAAPSSGKTVARSFENQKIRVVQVRSQQLQQRISYRAHVFADKLLKQVDHIQGPD